MSQPPQPEKAQQPQPNDIAYTSDEWQRIGHDVLEAWKKTVDVQQQFNDIELRIRNYAITLLVAIVGAAAYSGKQKIQIFGRTLPIGAPLLFAGLVSLAGFYFMDRFWYHRLLQGAVKHGMRIEERCKGVCDAIGLAIRIKEESPFTVIKVGNKKLKIHSERKIDIFYGIIAVMLILLIFAFRFSMP